MSRFSWFAAGQELGGPWAGWASHVQAVRANRRWRHAYKEPHRVRPLAPLSGLRLRAVQRHLQDPARPRLPQKPPPLEEQEQRCKQSSIEIWRQKLRSWITRSTQFTRSTKFTLTTEFTHATGFSHATRLAHPAGTGWNLSYSCTACCWRCTSRWTRFTWTCDSCFTTRKEKVI